MTNLMQLSITLNTQDISVALVLRCRGNMVFWKILPAIKNLKEKVNMLFESRFMMFKQNLSQEGSLLHLLAPQAANLSSMGSMTSLGTWYPIYVINTPYSFTFPSV
jgi:hypothetical protein